MAPKDGFYDAVCADPQFRHLVRKKRIVSFVLFGIAMALFFSIPLISSFAPGLFKVRVFSSINLGLVYLIFQYIAGGLIAWKYASMLRNIDKESAALVSGFKGRA